MRSCDSSISREHISHYHAANQNSAPVPIGEMDRRLSRCACEREHWRWLAKYRTRRQAPNLPFLPESVKHRGGQQGSFREH